MSTLAIGFMPELILLLAIDMRLLTVVAELRLVMELGELDLGV